MPQFPGGKKVFLSSKQIVWSAAAPDVVTFVEPDAMVGIFHYEMWASQPKVTQRHRYPHTHVRLGPSECTSYVQDNSLKSALGGKLTLAERLG